MGIYEKSNQEPIIEIISELKKRGYETISERDREVWQEFELIKKRDNETIKIKLRRFDTPESLDATITYFRELKNYEIFKGKQHPTLFKKVESKVCWIDMPSTVEQSVAMLEDLIETAKKL